MDKTIVLKPEPKSPFRPDVIAFCASTGGPNALLDVFDGLKSGFHQPVFIVQHMPPPFTALLASQIAKRTGLGVTEAVHGEVIKPGNIYIAPADFHLQVKENHKTMVLNREAPENFCRPSADRLLKSLALTYGAKVLVIFLTGMGQDGLKGAEAVVNANGVVIAQDKETSVIWGMPGAVAKAGLCTHIVSLTEMAKTIRSYAGEP